MVDGWRNGGTDKKRSVKERKCCWLGIWRFGVGGFGRWCKYGGRGKAVEIKPPSVGG